jgi:beta-galactosidase
MHIKMKNKYGVWLIPFLIFIAANGQSPNMQKIAVQKVVEQNIVEQNIVGKNSNERYKYNFNQDWKMWVGDDSAAAQTQYNDTSWKSVTLPHAFNEDDAFKVSIDQLTTGIVWYRKSFVIPATQKGQKVFLEWEGIRHAGEFYLNGKWIGRSENGVMAFGFDISDDIRFGEKNIIAVRIDNSWSYHEKDSKSPFQWNDKNFYANYGGINKNVFLHITNKLYQTLPLYSNLKTTGVYVFANQIDISQKLAMVTASSQIKNEYKVPITFQYQVRIQDAVTGKLMPEKFKPVLSTLAPNEIKTIETASLIHDLHFWSWGYGYLYNVITTISINDKVIDEVTTTTGFRKTVFDHGVLSLNDKVIQLKGYAQRTTNEWPAIGLSVPAWLSDYSNQLMVDGNANLVRWMHVTPWKQDIESCDRVGLMQAMPAGDSEKDVEGRRWEQRKEVMRDAIIYNRNNPSIIFIECGNNAISEMHMKEMKAIRDLYDSHGGRAIGSRNMLDSKEAEYGGEMLYINKSASKPMWQMEYSRDEGLRKYWDEFSPPFHKEGEGPLYNGQDASAYNHNQDQHAIENVVRWFDYWKERPGTGKRVNAGGVNIIFSESNTHHRGAENFRRSGEVDAMRIPKDGYFAHQAMWDGWVDATQPTIHIIGHWNYEKGVTKNIYVVANTDRVELFINNRSVGFGEKSNHFLFTFKNIKWEAGTITAIGYNANSEKRCTAQHSTAGSPYAIRLSNVVPEHTLLANGADLAMVEVEVVDNKGQRCPTALNEIQFELTGPGEWRGGMAQGPDNYILSKILPVECGVNRFFIRSTTQPGDIMIKAVSKGLQAAALQLTSMSYKVSGGLSLQLPSQGLPFNLSKGPTPIYNTVTPTRKSLTITASEAGANNALAKLSYDDNESSDWVNDGNLSTAWIGYQLDSVSYVNEVALKLNNFRTRSYPIKIYVDEHLVFEGLTSKNLGYFTAVFAPTRGQRIKIQLTGQSQIKQDDNKEVNGKKLDDGVSRNDANAKGTFSIIEAEIYGPLH